MFMSHMTADATQGKRKSERPQHLVLNAATGVRHHGAKTGLSHHAGAAVKARNRLPKVVRTAELIVRIVNVDRPVSFDFVLSA
jgi:hypothetical protein